MKTLTIFTVLFIFIACIANAQNFERDILIPASMNGSTLVNPWAGGMDAPEYSTIDLNGDNIKDLFVFDRLSDRISTFLNNGTPGQIDYHYAPQYISSFPELINWVQLVDFNCDGKEDIFTDATSGGMKVYLNVSTTSIQFVLFDSMLVSDYGNFIANLYCPFHGLATFIDVDGDSDLDILTPSPVPGINYHKNLSFDLYGTCDSLKFVVDNVEWGGVPFRGGGNESRHYLALDMDSDGDKDLLTNNVSVSGNTDLHIIKYYENTGTALVADLTLVQDSFPNANAVASVRGFAAAFEFDADNDSKTDIIVSPQFSSMQNINNSWLLKDTSSSTVKSFENVMNNFLCNGMIDVGSGANVRFADVDVDGLLDIIIGNFVRHHPSGNDSSSIYYFRNTGTASFPAFEFVTDNFANSIAPQYGAMIPTFGDIDGDQDNDMLVGLYDGTISCYINNSGNFSITATNYQGIDVGANNAPYLFDIDQDGLLDLICGNRYGVVQYFHNTGTINAPIFTLENALWGNVDVAHGNSVYGYSCPVIYIENGSLELFVGSESGTIFRYGNISGNLMGTFTLVDSMYGGINEKHRLTIDVADINNDLQQEILTGNYSGGIVIYKQTPVSLHEISSSAPSLLLLPNPTSSRVTIQGISNNEIQITNLLGEVLYKKTLNNIDIVEIDVSAFSDGIYFVRSGQTCAKLIVNK